MDIQQILDALNENGVRATYGAVGALLGIPAISVGRHLGDPCPRESWIVSASSGKPSGYSQQNFHSALFRNPAVLRTGAELKDLVEHGKIPQPPTKKTTKRIPKGNTELEASQETRSIRLPYTTKGVQIAGLDLAWKTEKNGSGIAIGEFTGSQVIVKELHCGVIGLTNIQRLLDHQPPLSGVAIDAPLIIKNEDGARPCEHALNRIYRQKWAGCHPSNLKNPNLSDGSTTSLSAWLESRGLKHLGSSDSSGWQIECYPHPAIIELFGLDKRLKYKKGSPREKIAGQIALAQHLRSLSNRPRLSLIIPSAFDQFLDPAHIKRLSGTGLKHNEDALDALVCLYVAGQYAAGIELNVFGDTKTGYIVVPRGGCLPPPPSQ